MTVPAQGFQRTETDWVTWIRKFDWTRLLNCHGHKLQEQMYNDSGHLTIKRFNSYPVID